MANIPISSFTAAANATGIGMSGFSLTGTNAQSMLDLAGTWNTSGAPTGIKLNVTDTASNIASLLADLQVSGTSRFNVTKAGVGYFSGSIGVGTVSPISGAGVTVGNDAVGTATIKYSFSTSSTERASISMNGSSGEMRFSAGYAVYGGLSTFYTNGLERMRLDVNGNLGIGTNSPGALLDVNGTARAGNFRVNAGGSVTGAGMWGIDTILAFNTGSLERMRIDSVGNTGIGTATPATKLHVEGGAYSALRLTSNTGISAELYGRPSAGDDSAQIHFFTSAGVLSTVLGSIGGSLRFFTNGATERMRILSGGELCVGRTASLNSGTLSVLGTATQAITAQVTVDGNSLIQGYNASTGLAFQVLGTGQGYYAGNLGIGTTSPAARIHTNGGASGINSVFESNTSADTRIELRNNATRAGYLYWDANEVRLLADPTRAVTIFTNGVERMRVDNAGAVVLPKLTLSTDAPFLTGANINSAANPLAIGSSGGGVVAFFSNNIERMRVKANGQVRFVPLAAAPLGAEAGDVYYDSTTNKLRCYNGTIWNDLF
jgi:hypothetical protein